MIFAAVIQVTVCRAFDDQKTLVIRKLVSVDHVFIGILSEIEGMCLVSVHDHDGISDLVAVMKETRIEKRSTGRDIPAVVGIKGTPMIAAVCLIVIVIILHKLRGIFRKRVDDTAGRLVFTGQIVNRSLGIDLYETCHP